MFSYIVVSLCLLNSVWSLPIDHKREYQVQLFEANFTNRAAGINSYFNYLKTFEGNPAYSFTINVTSGYTEIIHEKRYDTPDFEFDALNVDIKVQNTQTGPDAGSWVAKLKYKGTDPIVTRTQPLDVSAQANNPSRKLEFDYHRYDIGNSLQSKSTVPANWAPATVSDVEYYFTDVNFLPGISLGEALTVPTIAKGDFYTWQLSEIAVTFNGVAYKGTLIILYDDYNGAYFETSAPFRVEFSWRYEGTVGGTQMSYDPNTCMKMMNLMLAITDNPAWINDSPSGLGDYVY